MSRSLAAVAMLAAASVVAVGCYAGEPRSPVAGLETINPPQPPDLGHHAARYGVDVMFAFTGDPIRGACGGPDPMFKVASARTGAGNTPTLQVLAHCMLEGPLRASAIRVTGRTDPRGEGGYNERLGLRRAEHVKRYLVTQGVSPERIVVASLGAQDASADPASWRTDRRVDIEIVR